MENAPGRVSRAYVGFGGNLGDPASTLRAAAADLGGRGRADIGRFARLPVGSGRAHRPAAVPERRRRARHRARSRRAARRPPRRRGVARPRPRRALGAAHPRPRPDLVRGRDPHRCPSDAAASARARARVRAAPVVRPRTRPAARRPAGPRAGSPRSTRRAWSERVFRSCSGPRPPMIGV